MKTKVLLGILTLLIFSGVAFAQGALVEAIEVRGNKVIHQKVILAPLATQVGDPLNETVVTNDIRTIYSLGYFKNVEASFEAYNKGYKVIYSVEENPVINKIQVQGNTVYSTKEVLSLVSFKPGNVLDYKKVREDIATIKDRYQEDGYIMGRVIDVNMEPKKSEMTFIIREGVVEAVTLEGNDVTLDYVIKRELNTKAGTVFNEKVLSKDLRRIFNLGFFSSVNPVFIPGTGPDKIIIVLKVEEARTNTINFGGGYGERDGWFGFTDLSVNNLVGTGQSLLLKAQAGQQLSTYQFKYYNPWFVPDKLGDRTSFTFRLWNTMGTDVYLTQQDEWHVGWDVALGKQLHEEWSVSYSLGSESVSPREGATFEAYSSDWIGVSMSYDTRDFWMNPSRGVYHTLSLKEGWKFADAATAFTKVGADFNFYIPLAPNQVFANHWGFGVGFGDVPIGEEYWTGGPNTVRGFSLDDIHRGTKKMLTNFEYRYTFNDTFQGVFFFDWGNAWTQGAPVPSDFMAGWGPGVRLNTPLGPIRLDYGIPSNASYGKGILHFTIGQAF